MQRLIFNNLMSVFSDKAHVVDYPMEDGHQDGGGHGGETPMQVWKM